MYNWQRKGLVFDTKINLPAWAMHSALQPTPILLSEDIIRMYVGMRDSEGVSRIGYVDLSARDPADILEVSSSPALGVGVPGAFDDNGVVPSAVIYCRDKYYLYYAGYSLLKNVRFSVLGGLAVSNDGRSFKRVQEVPVFERTDQHMLFRVPHSVIHIDGIFRFWYGGGREFFAMNDYTYPIYDIYACQSSNLSDIPSETTQPILTFEKEDEYRVARPYVVFDENVYRMFLCVATKTKGYRLGYAESSDGVLWKRDDGKLNFDVSPQGWDSEMMGYPSFVRTKYGSYLFYNGNNYGIDGFGCAKLVGEQ